MLTAFTPHQLQAVLAELVRQRNREWWENSYPIAQLSALTANIHRDPKRRGRAYTPEEFLPRPESEKRKQTWEEQLAVVEALNAAFGGEENREG